MILSDFPKLHSPFVRQHYKVGPHKTVYFVVNKINPGYEWVFDDPDTFAVEKLDGSNVKIMIEDGQIKAIQNRMNIVDPYRCSQEHARILQGVYYAMSEGYLKFDGERAGELIGPKYAKNPYDLNHHIWYPFSKTISDLKYVDFPHSEPTFERWSEYFRTEIKSLMGSKLPPEGIIFYNLKRQEQGLVFMSKLRRDMFRWHYRGEVKDYDPNTYQSESGSIASSL